MIETLFQVFQDLMIATGYWGLFLLMALESMIAPVPSEGVMPFAGFLSYQGHFNLGVAALVSALGSIAGSLISYWMGLNLGRPAILRWGKYLLMGERELALTERWFHAWGEKAVFICRFIPVVRHLISIPAGIGKMNLPKFILYTFVGALIWNSFLLYLGYALHEQWELIHTYSKEIDLIVLVLLLTGGIWLLIRHLKNRQKTAP